MQRGGKGKVCAQPVRPERIARVDATAAVGAVGFESDVVIAAAAADDWLRAGFGVSSLGFRVWGLGFRI